MTAELDDDTRRRLMDAGAAAIRFNAPLGDRRVDEIVTFVGERAGTVLDLGCGAGALLIELATRRPELRGLGLDTGSEVIERATAAAALAGSAVAERVHFEVGDVDECQESADAALCIGSTHAFGRPGQVFAPLAKFGRSVAVVGDGMWTAPPAAEHREIFGDLPDGEDELGAMAEAAGWTVVDSARSSLEEWDAFELGWIDGVRSVGTAEAATFADSRLADYRSYRGVLGFAWLFLTRAPSS